MSETEITPQSIAADSALGEGFYDYPLSPVVPQQPVEASTSRPAGADGDVPGPGEAADGSPPPAASPDEPTPRTHKRSVRSVLIVTDDATVIRHSQLRALLEVAGDTRTLGEAIGVHQSTISRALAGSSAEALSRDQRIRAVRLLIGTEEGL